MKGSQFLGVEIGGTKLQLAVGAGDGALTALWRGSVDPTCGGEGIRRQILSAVPQLLTQAHLDPSQIDGVGIGFGGPVDDSTQTVIKSHQIPGWDDFPLAEWVSQLLGWPVALGNDADVAGLAEALFGAGKELSPVFYITVGSGIGGGLILDGKIHRGVGRGAAEIGHLRMPLGDRHVPLEQIASGWGMQQRAAGRVRCEGTLTVQTLATAAEHGDPEAQAVLREALEALAEGMCHVLALVCPRRFVIGGGVSLLGERLFFEPLRQYVAERVFRPFAGCYDIVPAALGEEVVLHGALALARQRLDRFARGQG